MKKAILLSAVIFTLLFSIACHHDPLEEGDLFVSLDGKYLVSPNDLEDNSNTVKSGYSHTYTYFENYRGYAFGTTFMNDENWVSSYTGYFCMGDYYYTISISSNTKEYKDLLVSIFDEIKNQGGVDNYESLNSIVNSIDSNYFFAFTIGKVNLSKTNENEIVLVDINTSNENRLCIFSEINLN